MLLHSTAPCEGLASGCLEIAGLLLTNVSLADLFPTPQSLDTPPVLPDLCSTAPACFDWLVTPCPNCRRKDSS